MESLGEFKSRQQSTSVVELQFPSEEPAAVTLREEDGLKKISDKAASFFLPSPLCLDDPSSLACFVVVVRLPSIHLSPYPIWHGYACQEKKPQLLSSSLRLLRVPVKRPKVPKIARQGKKEKVSRREWGDRSPLHAQIGGLPPSTARARRPGPFPRMDELALLCVSSATLFDRDRAFVDSDFGVFHDSSGAAIDAMGRPIGREMKGGSEEEDTRQPNGILLFCA